MNRNRETKAQGLENEVGPENLDRDFTPLLVSGSLASYLACHRCTDWGGLLVKTFLKGRRVSDTAWGKGSLPIPSWVGTENLQEKSMLVEYPGQTRGG
jgi:hypothetical protein